jgi:hypothetical protein
MPTYLNNTGGGVEVSGLRGLNCRQVYEHVQGCPVCQQLFIQPVMKQQRLDPMSHQFMGTTGVIEIQPTVAFIVVVLIIMMLMYIIRNN